MVRTDAEQLRQVLMNLVSTALGAVDEEGTLTISTRRRQGGQPGWHGGSAQASADWIEIAVSDDGPGIPPNVYEHMFVPFFTTKDKGTGLGLAISQRMVEDMGGRIEAISTPGAGATFVVVLPSATDHQTQGHISRLSTADSHEPTRLD
jgi:signal transduction histidine kinase